VNILSRDSKLVLPMRISEKGYSTGKYKVVAGLLIVLFVGLILGYLWRGRFDYYKTILLGATYLGTIAAVLFSHLYFRDTRRELGLRRDNFAQALRVATVPNLILLAVIVIWGLLTGGLSVSWDSTTLLYLPWAFLQQYVLQNFLLARFGNILGKTNAAAIAASLVFALIHLPNVALVMASLIGALVWTRIFLKAPNIFVVSLSHALLGILVVIFFKFSGFDQLHVGKAGYAYQSFGDGVLVASGYDASGKPIVVTLPGHDKGNPSLVRVFEPSGGLRSEWVAFPEYDFSGNLAVGELGFRQGDEIVVSPGPGISNPPELRIFDITGTELNRFTLDQDPGYGAAVTVSAGRILACPGPGPERPARIFEYRPDGSLVKEWDFGEIGFHNSVRAQRLPLRGKGGQGDSSRLLLWANVLSVNSSNIQVYDESADVFETWENYGTAFGLNLALIQLGEGRIGVVTGPGSAPGHGPQIMVFDDQGQELQNLFGYEDESPCGIHVAGVDLDGDFIDEIVLGEGICPDQPSIVRIIDQNGKLIHQWDAY
jgi:hypothetical protein